MRLTDMKRQSIVDAAVLEFQENGFSAARINRIAERAQVSKRTLYNHFESKEALFDEIVEIIMARNASVRHVSYDPNQPIRDQLIAETEAIVAEVADDTYIGLNRVIASEYLRDKELARKIFSREEVTTDPVSGIIDAAMKAGALRQADPILAASQYHALVKHFFVWPHFLLGEAPPFSQSKEEIIEECVDMFLARYET
jgi:TetR/AcrR family transcriptional regulator of autoinduction and epiphytic fitness